MAKLTFSSSRWSRKKNASRCAFALAPLSALPFLLPALIIDCDCPGAGGSASAGSGSRSPSSVASPSLSSVPGSPFTFVTVTPTGTETGERSIAPNVGVSTALVAGDAKPCADEVDNCRFFNRPPVARSAASLAGLPAARLLMIFLSAWMLARWPRCGQVGREGPPTL